MIFVTVGTHEQQFNRLVKEVDDLVLKKQITNEVFMQIGYSTYEPRNTKWSKILSYTDMQKYISQADIVITHGGPASFIAVLQCGKIPIVVPRLKEYGEHINNHQVEFIKFIGEKTGNILPVYDIGTLKQTINGYDKLITTISPNLNSNTTEFCEKFEELIDTLFID